MGYIKFIGYKLADLDNLMSYVLGKYFELEGKNTSVAEMYKQANSEDNLNFEKNSYLELHTDVNLLRVHFTYSPGGMWESFYLGSESFPESRERGVIVYKLPEKDFKEITDFFWDKLASNWKRTFRGTIKSGWFGQEWVSYKTNNTDTYFPSDYRTPANSEYIALCEEFVSFLKSSIGYSESVSDLFFQHLIGSKTHCITFKAYGDGYSKSDKDVFGRNYDRYVKYCNRLGFVPDGAVWYD